MKIKALISSILLLAVVPAFAQLITDRPDQTESAVAIPLGSFQFETGFFYSSAYSDPKVKNYLMPTTLLRYGIIKGLEIRFVAQYGITKAGSFKHNGFSDLEIGAKFEIFRSPKTNMAFLSHLIIPSASDDYRPDKIGTVNKFAISHEISETIGIAGNLGYSNFGEGNGDLTYALVLGFSLTEKLSTFVEPYGELVGFEWFVLNVDTGLTYLINNNMQFDASFGIGILQQMHFFSIGFSWNIPKK